MTGMIGNNSRYSTLSNAMAPFIATVLAPLVPHARACHMLMTHYRCRFKDHVRDILLLISSILPIPNLSQEMLHIDLLGVHLDHPGMFEHAPWCCSSQWFLFQAAPPLISASDHVIDVKESCAGRVTHQHSIKYLKFSLHLIPFSSSSFNFGIGCLTI